MIKKIILISLLIINFPLSINGYLFWIKSFDNTIDNIKQIEEKYNFDFPIIAFIFDPRSEKVEQTLTQLKKNFWENKIYHITISPNMFSAKEVFEWKFDDNYKKFFELVKENNLKVIFRTMHEMNGGRYPRSSNPIYFKKARIHVWNLSRELWLDQKNILFDMSVNHRDMPTKYKPWQTANLIKCNQKNKYKEITTKIFVETWYMIKNIETKIAKPQSTFAKIWWREIEYDTIWQTISIPYPIYETKVKKEHNCYTFEDYYPWDKYVDIMWVTFYNRWKASYNRHRLYPNQILNDPNRDTLSRIKKIKKPIFIDEVWTTAVRYNWSYNQELSKDIYQKTHKLKNKRLISLKDFMLKNSEILWMVYFNIDYTYWLNFRMIWEADRAIINLNNNKFYEWTYELYNWQKIDKLTALFQSKPKKIQNNKKSNLTQKLIEKFWVEESIKRLENIFKTSTNTELIQIIENTLKELNEIK